MQLLMRSITALWILLLASFPSWSQQSLSLPRIFDQLQSERTTDQGMSEFVRLGLSNEEARAYLAQRLPALIDKQPNAKTRHSWLNSVRLAGIFRINEAISPLTKWINSATEDSSGTLFSTYHLEGFPCAKALTQIGEPAVPALTEILEKGDLRRRWFAYRALFLIGSPRALTALKTHVDQEHDEGFKKEIQQALDSK